MTIQDGKDSSLQSIPTEQIAENKEEHLFTGYTEAIVKHHKCSIQPSNHSSTSYHFFQHFELCFQTLDFHDEFKLSHWSSFHDRVFIRVFPHGNGISLTLTYFDIVHRNHMRNNPVCPQCIYVCILHQIEFYTNVIYIYHHSSQN